MPTPVIMPKFEMAQETGTVSKWLKEEGEPVEKGEAILEVETDKINMEVEAPASGLLVDIQVGPGAIVPIGQLIAHIIQPGEVWPATPQDEKQEEIKGIDRNSEELAHRGPWPGLVGPLRLRATSSALGTPGNLDFPKVKAVPAARRLAREMKVDLELIAGTGPGGRVQSEDVRQAIAKQAVAAAPLVPPAPSGSSKPAIRRTIPLTGMRRTIAERLTASIREIPQFTVSVDVDMSRALTIVEDWRVVEANGPRVTLTAFLVKVCAWTLLRHPVVNASFEQDSIIEWAEVNIGVAMAVDEGLLVPVIHQANQLGLADIAAQLADLTGRAREGRLRLEDVQAGTFTISNLGMFGVDRFTAILYPPQAAILAVGRVVKQPVVAANDEVEVRPIASFTLTVDHRVLDGALAGRFLADLRGALERPGALL